MGRKAGAVVSTEKKRKAAEKKEAEVVATWKPSTLTEAQIQTLVSAKLLQEKNTIGWRAALQDPVPWRFMLRKR